jgi:endonuclease-3 related protein
MDRSREIRAAYRRLRRANGPLGWWPGDTALEIAVGAILTQNTNWSNVERAIAALKQARILSVAGLRAVTRPRLERLIRPSGYFRQKARKLKCFLRFLDEQHGGSLSRMAATSTGPLREQLLGVWGIGPETADSILLYACGHAVFVVDAYTLRIAVRHGWVERGASYAELQDVFMRSLPLDIGLYNDYHAQLVWAGKNFCRAQPACGDCPLSGLPRRAAG